MIGVLLAAALVAPPACSHDAETLLRLPYAAFDRAPEKGWRVVGEVEGCEAAGAELIKVYRERHQASLSLEERQGLAWHEGQLRAAAGEDNERAAALLSWARLNDEHVGDRLYAEATVAFLRKDRPGLLAARSALAALPKPDGFAESAARAKAKFGLNVTWPPNLDVVDGFIACFDRPYIEAYGVCRPKP